MDHFFDSNRGNDNNDGLSPATAWQNPYPKLATVTNAVGGDNFLFASDSSWVLTPSQRIVPSSSWRGRERNPVVIGKYDPSSQSVGQRPLITLNMETVASDWTYNAPLNGWTMLYPTAHINNAAMVRLYDSWDASCTDDAVNSPVASVDGRYAARSDNQTILLYAPAGINPVDYYGKVVIGAQAVGAINLSSGRYWITVQDIAFRETGCGVLCYSQDANPAGFVVQRCRSDIGTLATLGGATPGNLRAWVRDNEANAFGAIGIHINSTGGAGIAYAEVYRNKIANGVHNWAQGGIYIQARDSATRNGILLVHGNDISGCNWGTRDKRYDGCGIYAETGADGAQIFGNIVHDCFVAFQDNSGRRNIWSGNLVYNCRRGMRITDEKANNQSDVHVYNNTFLVGDLDQNATEFGNTIQGADYPGIWMLKGTSTLNLTAKNNIIANVGGQRGRAAFGFPSVWAASALKLSGNWVYGFETDALRGDTDAAVTPSPAIVHAGTADPRPFLESDGRLKVPYLVDGVMTQNPLGDAGTYVALARLMGGARHDPVRIPMGAVALAA